MKKFIFLKTSKNHLTKKEFCKMLKPAESWEEIIHKDFSYIRNIVSDLKKIDKVNKLLRDSDGVIINNSKISTRFLSCYHLAILKLSDCKFNQSLHELHDAIYVFGKSLDEEVNDIEYLFIVQWIQLFDFYTFRR